MLVAVAAEGLQILILEKLTFRCGTGSGQKKIPFTVCIQERKKERKNYARGRELGKKLSLQASLPYTTPSAFNEVADWESRLCCELPIARQIFGCCLWPPVAP